MAEQQAPGWSNGGPAEGPWHRNPDGTIPEKTETVPSAPATPEPGQAPVEPEVVKAPDVTPKKKGGKK
jgi:hypothetical protein